MARFYDAAGEARGGDRVRRIAREYSRSMPVVETRYAVEGWGVGELWMRGGVVIAHWFDFDAVTVAADEAGSWARPVELELPAAEVRAAPVRGAPTAPPVGAHGPPCATLPTEPRRVVHAFVPIGERRESAVPVDATVLVERVRAYLAGAAVGFDDVVLDLDGCTPFQRAVTEALRAVPRGEVVTYGELAALAGHPGAQRAAGTFCAGNRFALVVPCHRVVAANGIGGYGSTGVAVKSRLLALEGVRL
jgi:methylated-DNA-[protein]-cysteine S-methyltransferase